MGLRNSPAVSSNATRTLVCVDRFEDFEISGRLYNLYVKETIKFFSILDMAEKMESLFNTLSFPQSSVNFRSFQGKKEKPHSLPMDKEMRHCMDNIVFQEEQGEKSTFIVQVQFRQNATWQGTITWTEEKKTQHFRSTLELIKLMNDALSDENEERLVGWETTAQSI